MLIKTDRSRCVCSPLCIPQHIHYTRGVPRASRNERACVCLFVCVCIDGTCIITLKDKRGCSHREGWMGRGNVTGSTPAGTSIHQHTVASGTNWSLLNCKPRLPSMCLCLPLPRYSFLSLRSPPTLPLPPGRPALTQPRLSPINPTVQDPLARPPVTARQMMRCPGPLPRRIP